MHHQCHLRHISELLSDQDTSRLASYWLVALWSANQAGNNRRPEQWAGCRSVGSPWPLPDATSYFLFDYSRLPDERHTHTPLCLPAHESKEKAFCRRLVLIWKLECFCDNVARFVGRSLIDLCEAKGELCGVYAHDSDILRHQKLHFWICWCAFLCWLMTIFTDGLPGFAHKQPLNEGIVALALKSKLDCHPSVQIVCCGPGPFAWPSLAYTTTRPSTPSPPGRR